MLNTSYKLFLKLSLLMMLPGQAFAIGASNGEEIAESQECDGVCLGRIPFKRITNENLSGEESDGLTAHFSGFLIQVPEQFSRLAHRVVLTCGHSLVAEEEYLKAGFKLDPQAVNVHFTSGAIETVTMHSLHPNFLISENRFDQALLLLQNPVFEEAAAQINYNSSYTQILENLPYDAISEGTFTAWGPSCESDWEEEEVDEQGHAPLKRKVNMIVHRDKDPYTTEWDDQEVAYAPETFVLTTAISHKGENCELKVSEGGITEKNIKEMSSFYCVSGDSGGKLDFGNYVALLSTQVDYHFDKDLNPLEELDELPQKGDMISIQENVYQLPDVLWIKETLEQWKDL